MNADSCPEIPLTFPRAVRAWETSDRRLFNYNAQAVAREHEAKLKEAAEEKQLLRAFSSRRLYLGYDPVLVDLKKLRTWLKDNPELVERLVNA